jgi:hypothetical protein
MKKLKTAKITDVLSLLGGLTSAVGLAIGILLMTNIEKEWIVAGITLFIGLLAGLSSNFLTDKIRKLSHSRRIFLSYSQEDQKIVEEIATSLRGTGAKVWLDKERIKAGQIIQEEIANAIDEADRVVVFIGKKTSPNVMFEIGVAHAKGKKIIPVILEAGPIPADISNLKSIDLSTNKDIGIKELIDSTI